MRSTTGNPVYNARNPPMRISVGFSGAACLVLMVLLQAGAARAEDWQAPAGQLAKRIAGITGPGAVAISLVNRSSLTAADTDQIHRRLISELAAYGVQASASDQAASTLQVSLSENLQNYLWVAEIHQGTSEPVVIMISVPGAVEGPTRPSAPLSIRKSLLWSSDNRMLDVAVISGNPAHMIVLEPEKLGLYGMQNGNWQQEQSLAIVHVRPWPRDLRGRLMLRKDHLFDAYLPGVYCRSSTTTPLSVSCNDSDDPWPMTGSPGDPRAFFASTRNFFTGALSPGIQKQTTAPAFYTAAPLPRNEYTLWVFAALDGRIHFLDGMTDQTFPQLSWGSDIASVRSGCGPSWQILITTNGDGPADEVRAFEILDRQPAPVSGPAEFQGPITALWTDSDLSGVIAVSHNSETGKYEAYRLSIDCHQ